MNLIEELAPRLLFLIPILLCLTVHEWAHAWAAYRLGDDTAALLGRLTLNPIAHIDPVGTLLLPLLGVPFGWAKPVPVQPMRFYSGISMRLGMVIVAVAGPISNVVLALLSAAALFVTLRIAPELLDQHRAAGGVGGAVWLLEMMIRINVVLAAFNMLPVPPLDGSRIVDGLLPERYRGPWEAFVRVGPLALIALLILPFFTGFSPIGWLLGPVGNAIAALEFWAVGP